MKNALRFGIGFIFTLIFVRLILMIINGIDFSVIGAFFIMFVLTIVYGTFSILLGRGVKNIPVRSLQVFLKVTLSIIFALSLASSITWSFILITHESIAPLFIIPSIAFFYFFLVGVRYSDDMRRPEQPVDLFEQMDQELFEEEGEEEDFFAQYYKNKKQD